MGALGLRLRRLRAADGRRGLQRQGQQLRRHGRHHRQVPERASAARTALARCSAGAASSPARSATSASNSYCIPQRCASVPTCPAGQKCDETTGSCVDTVRGVSCTGPDQICVARPLRRLQRPGLRLHRRQDLPRRPSARTTRARASPAPTASTARTAPASTSASRASAPPAQRCVAGKCMPDRCAGVVLPARASSATRPRCAARPTAASPPSARPARRASRPPPAPRPTKACEPDPCATINCPSDCWTCAVTTDGMGTCMLKHACQLGRPPTSASGAAARRAAAARSAAGPAAPALAGAWCSASAWSSRAGAGAAEPGQAERRGQRQPGWPGPAGGVILRGRDRRCPPSRPRPSPVGAERAAARAAAGRAGRLGRRGGRPGLPRRADLPLAARPGRRHRSTRCRTCRRRCAQALTADAPAARRWPQDVVQTARDGTRKLRLRTHDGRAIESVLIPDEDADRNKLTLCVSSQVGCAIDCRFCATATLGFGRHLGAGEIVEQVYQRRRAGRPPAHQPGVHGDGRAAAQLRQRDARAGAARAPLGRGLLAAPDHGLDGGAGPGHREAAAQLDSRRPTWRSR